MLRGFAFAVLAVAVSACASDRSPEAERERIVSGLVEDLTAETDGALDETQASCVAETLVDTIGIAAFDDLLDDAAAGREPAGLRTQVIDVFAGCDALAPILEADLAENEPR